MSQNNKIAHYCSSGDILLIGTSRKHPDQWTTAGVILGKNIIYSIKVPGGYQAVQQNIYDFLEHESKPVSLFRYQDKHLLSESPKLVDLINRMTKTRPSWWRQLILRQKPIFCKDNSLNMTRVITSHLGIIELLAIERIGEFVHLL